ncbi:SDR family oxidoreductase [Campylobacter volucris]|uniref:SDR family oxidoreductase n=1 Tax=Campylobacter volucris TaxID=1031542 RepID=UPI00189E2301|nr:SDR family oxidoreductase [Campylobacter volucris]MBF7069103.1 SDR family oxidoreductase [Campylobacter volucris]
MKNIIITGVSSGLGKAFVKKFSTYYKIFGLSRNKSELLKLEEEHPNFVGFECDITCYKQVESIFSQINFEVNNIDFLVNNAAIFKIGKLLEFKIDELDKIIDTNLKGQIYTTYALLKEFQNKLNDTRIINIASVAALHGIKGQSIYCASKFGLKGFADALAQEINIDNIQITTIFPGGINTPLWNKNLYPLNNGDSSIALDTADILQAIEYLFTLKSNVVLKDLTIFPSIEWH